MAETTWVRDASGHLIDYKAAVNLMDGSLREQVHAEMSPCSEQEFIERYAELHAKKFGEGFAPYWGNAW